MVASLALGVVQVVARTGRNGPPIGVALIVPVAIARGSRETEDDLVASVIVPVEGCIPAVGYLVAAVLAVEDGLCHVGTFLIAVFANIDLSIQIETHQEGGCTSLRPLTLQRAVAAQRRLLGQQGQTFLQVVLDEVEDHLRLDLRLSVLADVAEAHSQRYVAESVEQAQVEPGAQHAALCLQVLELGLSEAEARGVEPVQILNHVVALHNALEAAVPFRLCVATVFHIPVVVVQAAPLATVVPPTVASRGDELVGRKLVEYVTALDAPESVFERTEHGTHDVALCVIVVLCAHLVVERLVQVGAAGECRETQRCSQYIIMYSFHIVNFVTLLPCYLD